MFLAANEVKNRELAAEGGHWYYPDGRPCHTVEKADGTGTRPTTLADARKLGLYPSVTTISKVIGNPSLEYWKQGQMIQACTEYPHDKREDLEVYRQKVTKLARRRVTAASAFGTAFHLGVQSIIEDGFAGEECREVMPWLNHFVQWTRNNKVTFDQSEMVCVNHTVGYAGQLDAGGMVNGKRTLVDFKTQNIHENVRGVKTPVFYPSWGHQLGAYKHADWENKPAKINQVMSVVFDSNEPHYPWVKVWSKEEMAGFWNGFKCTAKLWAALNKYDPSKVVTGREGDPEL